jgi:hypothetical protein
VEAGVRSGDAEARFPANDNNAIRAISRGFVLSTGRPAPLRKPSAATSKVNDENATGWGQEIRGRRCGIARKQCKSRARRHERDIIFREEKSAVGHDTIGAANSREMIVLLNIRISTSGWM